MMNGPATAQKLLCAVTIIVVVGCQVSCSSVARFRGADGSPESPVDNRPSSDP